MPKENNKVSVILPIYNASEFLDQCLESIEVQTHRDLEIICINDGSKDNSLDIIKKHAAKDDRYIVVDKKNEGYGAGCNRGIKESSGYWISIIEPDDWIGPTTYEEMIDFAESFGEQIDIVKCPWKNVCCWDDPKEQFTVESTMKEALKTSTKPMTLHDCSALIEDHPSIWSAIYRGDFIRSNNIKFVEYPGAGWADNPFLIETMCQAKSIVYLDKSFYNYRCDLPGSTLNHTTDDAIARPFERWMDMLDVIERLGITDEKILKSHYLRGFNYTFGAIHDDGVENPIVKEKTKELFSRMDPNIVFKMDILSQRRREYYCEVMGLECPKVSKWPRVKYLANQTRRSFKRYGFFNFFDRAKRNFYREPSELKGKRFE